MTRDRDLEPPEDDDMYRVRVPHTQNEVIFIRHTPHQRSGSAGPTRKVNYTLQCCVVAEGSAPRCGVQHTHYCTHILWREILYTEAAVTADNGMILLPEVYHDTIVERKRPMQDVMFFMSTVPSPGYSRDVVLDALRSDVWGGTRELIETFHRVGLATPRQMKIYKQLFVAQDPHVVQMIDDACQAIYEHSFFRII